MDVLVEAVKTNEFETVQFPFNAVETEAATALLPLAEKLDLGVIVMKPLAGGALTPAELALRFSGTILSLLLFLAWIPLNRLGQC